MAGVSRATQPVGDAEGRYRHEAAGIGALILLRLSAGDATRADLQRDLKAYQPSGAAQAKAVIEREVEQLVSTGLASRTGSRITLCEVGQAAVAKLLHGATACSPWIALRDGPLTLLALGADPADAKLAKSLQSADALRALIVQSAFGLDMDRALTLGKLRTVLALRALERAFGGQIKTALGTGVGLAPKPSRLLAAQLTRKPKDYGSDGKLVAALAAEHFGTTNADPDTLRTHLIRRWAEQVQLPAFAISNAATAASSGAEPSAMPSLDHLAPAAIVQAPPANDRGPAAEAPALAARPDLPGFVRAVSWAAAKRADGWPGNRKAFICHVFDEVRAAHSGWGLSEIEFKGMLAEAHRIGGVTLANADLKDKRFIQEFEKSAIQYKNTVWHFVRVEEP